MNDKQLAEIKIRSITAPVLEYEEETGFVQEEAYCRMARVSCVIGDNKEYIFWLEEPSDEDVRLLRFIAHAPQDIAALIAEVERLQLIIASYGESE